MRNDLKSGWPSQEGTYLPPMESIELTLSWNYPTAEVLVLHFRRLNMTHCSALFGVAPDIQDGRRGLQLRRSQSSNMSIDDSVDSSWSIRWLTIATACTDPNQIAISSSTILCADQGFFFGAVSMTHWIQSFYGLISNWTLCVKNSYVGLRLISRISFSHTFFRNDNEVVVNNALGLCV